MQWLKHVIWKKNLASSTTDLRIKQLTGGLKVQAYILMAAYGILLSTKFFALVFNIIMF